MIGIVAKKTRQVDRRILINVVEWSIGDCYRIRLSLGTVLVVPVPTKSNLILGDARLVLSMLRSKRVRLLNGRGKIAAIANPIRLVRARQIYV